VIAAFGFEYLQARLQGRLSGHPDAFAWRRIEGARTLSAALDGARATPFFAAFTAGVAPASGVHEIERACRARVRALIHEVARWMPGEWRGAAAWTQVLVDLPLLFHLHSGAPPLAWMQQDAALRSYLDPDREARRLALEGGPLAPLASCWSDAASLRRGWLAEWHRRLPPRAERAILDELADAVARHLQHFPETPVAEAWHEREALRAQVGRLFRRSVLDPAAAFGYLALAALDAERLRAELSQRAVFVEGLAAPC
jgi:hypothetical protein